MLEILVAVAILSLSCIPILYMASYNVETTRMDRVRIEAEAICHNTLERFGRWQDGLARYLPRSASSPKVREADNLWNQMPALYLAMGHTQIRDLVARHDLKMKIQIKEELAPGLDLLVCTVSWINDRERTRKIDRVSYARFILHAHGM